MYRCVFIISKSVNGKRKQTVTCFVFTYTKILNFKCHTNEQRSNKYTNQTLRPYLKCLCLYIILCFYYYSILLLPVSNLSSILTLSLMEQELLTLPQHLSSPPVFSWIRFTTGTRIPDPPFSSVGPSRDYGMDLSLEVYL